MAEVLTRPTERLPHTEQLRPHEPLIGLQARMRIGGDALNPTNRNIPEVTESSFTDPNYSPYEQLSIAERSEYWKKQGGEMTFDQQQASWIQDTTDTFTSAREFFTQTDQGKQWTQTLEKIGIHATSFNKDSATQLYTTYFAQEGGVKKFVDTTLAKYKTTDGFDTDALRRNLPTYQWIAGIFGDTYAPEIIAQLTDALATNPNTLAQQANQNARVNNITPQEADLLTALYTHRQHPSTQTTTETTAITGEKSLRDMLAELGLPTENKFDVEKLRALRLAYQAGHLKPTSATSLYEFLIDNGAQREVFDPHDKENVANKTIAVEKMWQASLRDAGYVGRLKDSYQQRYGAGFNAQAFEQGVAFFIAQDLNQVTTLNGLHDLYRNPTLTTLGKDTDGKDIGWNNLSPIHFQGTSGSFVHFLPSKLGAAVEDADTRIYLNPSNQAMGEVIKELMNFSLERTRNGESGIYFKFANPEGAHGSERTDRVVMYVSKKQLPDVLRFVGNVSTAHTDWFANRTVSSFLLRVADGIGVAEEPLDEAGQRFYRKEDIVSYNEVRAEALQDTLLYTALDQIVTATEGGTIVPIHDASGAQLSFEQMKDGVNKRIVDRKVINPRTGVQFTEAEMTTLMDAVLDKFKSFGSANLASRPMTSFYQLLDELFTDDTEKIAARELIWAMGNAFIMTDQQECLNKMSPVFAKVAEYYLVDPNNVALNYHS